jgi:anti-sigma factor RsiW
MHPDLNRLAAYLDGALDEAARADVRGHLLTCPACAARLERLRADARRITASVAGPAPDVRAAVRARLRRVGPATWLLRGGALAGALTALLLFALLIGVRAGGVTVGRDPDRLFMTDRQNGQLLALDAGSGAVLSALAVGDQPREVRYDRRLDQLYILLEQEVVAVDVRTLSVAHRWAAPQRFDVYSGMALDERRGRLYVAQPIEGAIALLDAATLTPTGSFHLGRAPQDLVLTPDGGTLFALDEDGMLWTIDTSDGAKSAQSLNVGGVWQRGWLAISSDGRTLYMLRSGAPAIMRHIDVRSGQIGAPVSLPAGPAPQDLLLLDDRNLAIPRGDNVRGGVAIVATDSLSATAQIDPATDEHHLVAGPQGHIFGLNFTHGRITRYDTAARKVIWRTPENRGWQPWDGAFVPGGWRWPW